METINERLSALPELLGYDTPAALARSCGVDPNTMRKAMQGPSKPSFDLLQAVLGKHKKLSSDWLMLGSGPVLKGSEPTPTSTPKDAEKPEAAGEAQMPKQVERRTEQPTMAVVRPTYEELLAENASLHKRLDEKDDIIADLRTDKGQLWQQNTRLIELGKDDASSDAAAPAAPLAWFSEPHRQVTGLVRYDQPENTCAHYDLATGLRVEELQVAKAA